MSPRKFNIVIASSTKSNYNLHAQCFFEVGLVLKYGLHELGYEVISSSGLRRDSTNIILGYHLLNGKKLPEGYDYIVYQLEELHDQSPLPVKIFDTLRSPNVVVWDFSQNNIEYLAEIGIQAIHKPIGFHPEMFRIQHCEVKDIDVLFFGSKNQRRLKVLNELNDHYNLKVLFGVYGTARDHWIGRSKIVVSIYYYETKFFDDVRMSYLLNNKVFAIVEDTPHRQYEDFIIYTPYDKIVETCENYRHNENLRRQLSQKAFDGFSKYPESEFLKKALALSNETLAAV